MLNEAITEYRASALNAAKETALRRASGLAYYRWCYLQRLEPA